MKIERRTSPPPPFNPFAIVIESREELISIRAVFDAAMRGQTIERVMRDYWGRLERDGAPQPESAQDFCGRLAARLSEDDPSSGYY